MSGTSHIEMHKEHTAWQREDRFWSEELAIWEHEIRQALTDMPQLEKALHDQASILGRHGAAIRLYQQSFEEHEHALVEYEQGEAPDVLITMASAHQQEAAKHSELRKIHEGLKKHQHILMAKWRLLLAAFTEKEPAAKSGDAETKRMELASRSD